MSGLQRRSALVVVSLCAACNANSDSVGADAGLGFDSRAMVSELVDHVFVPTYRDFEASSAELADDAGEFCAEVRAIDPSTPDGGVGDAGARVSSKSADTHVQDLLETTRDSWLRARANWKSAEAFAFGPYRDVDHRIGPAVDTWPARTERIETLLSGSDELTAEFFADQGSTSKGLPAIGYLLFAASPLDDATRLFLDERRCDYLVGATADLAAQGEEMVSAWTRAPTHYAEQLERAGEDSEAFETVHAAVSEIVNRMAFAVENVRSMKLGGPAGLASSEPQLEAFESVFSDSSSTDATNAIRSVRNVYLGKYGKADGLGIQDYVLARKAELDEQILDDFERSIEALESIDSFVLAVTDSPEDLELAYERLRELQLSLSVDMAGALGTTVTFNDTDGD